MNTKTPKTPALSAAAFYAESRAIVAQRVAEHSTQLAAAAALTERLDLGDDTVTGADLDSQDNATKVAAGRLGAARRAAAVAKTEADAEAAAAAPIVAEALASVLRAHAMTVGLYGVPITIAGSLPLSESDALEYPSVLLYQAAPAVADPQRGTYSGQVILTFVEDASCVLDRSKLRSALPELARAAGIGVVETFNNRGSRSLGDTATRRDLEVKLTNGVAALPVVLPTAQSYQIKGFAEALGSAIVANATNSGTTKGLGIRAGTSGDSSGLVHLVRTFVNSYSVTDVKVSAEGVIHRTVHAEILVTAPKTVSTDWLLAVAEAALRGQVGTFAGSLGRVESVAGLKIGPKPDGRFGVDVALVLVGQLS